MTIRFSPGAQRRELTPVDNLFIAEYLPDADGTDVMVYLYGLMQCYHPAMRDVSVADALGLSPERVQLAFLYWQERGLVHIANGEPLRVEYLTAQQPAVTTEAPRKYRELASAVNVLLAPRELTSREWSVIYECVELYGMDEDAVPELLAHCVQLRGKRISMNYLAAVARSWNERGIVTAAQAKEYIRDYEIGRHGAAELLLRWNKRRAPTQDEMALYERWRRDWGFDAEAILAVCGQMTDVATPSFKILGDRLDALRGKNIRTAEQLQAEFTGADEARAFAAELFARMRMQVPPTREQAAQIAAFTLPREVLLLAAEHCATAERPFGKLKTILKNWAEEGIQTEEGAIAKLSAFGQPKARGGNLYKKNPATAYSQREIRDEDFEHLFLNLEEDI
ncbi:MAG: DnaD domain protein [Clostridiales bacterium]|nr:DnaD domain protein [Clostridiales bacterium]